MFNELVALTASVQPSEDDSISRGKSLKICERVRYLLHRVLKIPKGDLTHTKMKELYDKPRICKSLEKHFPILRLPGNQWAADELVKDVARRDRTRRRRMTEEESPEMQSTTPLVGVSTTAESITTPRATSSLPRKRRTSQTTAQLGASTQEEEQVTLLNTVVEKKK